MQYPRIKITIEKTEEVFRNGFPASTSGPLQTRTIEKEIIYEQTIDSSVGSQTLDHVFKEIVKLMNEL